MSSPASDAYRAELEAQLSDLRPPLEGFRDYGRLNITADTQPPNQQQIEVYARREGLIATVVVAMDALDADGYPNIPLMGVPPRVFADLQQQATTILAALGRYRTLAEATVVEVSEGKLVPKFDLADGDDAPAEDSDALQE